MTIYLAPDPTWCLACAPLARLKASRGSAQVQRLTRLELRTPPATMHSSQLRRCCLIVAVVGQGLRWPARSKRVHVPELLDDPN